MARFLNRIGKLDSAEMLNIMDAKENSIRESVSANGPSKWVSIGMPVYNGEEYIRKAIDSLLSQAYPYFELIISDNASTDGTSQICEEYALADSRVRYIRQEVNIGAAPNFKYVVAEASHDYFMWAAADDYWPANWLNVLVSEITPDDTCVRGGVKRELHGCVVAEFFPREFFKGHWIDYFLHEETYGKVFHIYGLFWKEKLRALLKWLEDAYGADAIFCYSGMWLGNLRTVKSTYAVYTIHAHSVGTLQAAGFRWSLIRFLVLAHPLDYYVRYYRATPKGRRPHLLFIIPLKHILSQIHLWSRAFRAVVLCQSNLHGLDRQLNKL